MTEIRRRKTESGMDIGLYEGEQRLAGLAIIDRDIRIGSLSLRLGGIGGVGTHRQHRGNGYARLVLNDAITYLQEEHYPLSALFGIPGFYPKWGFAPALVESSLEVETRVALKAAHRLSVREMTPDDLAAILALYDGDNAVRTGVALRRQDTFKGFRFGVDWKDNVATLVAEERGKVVGYLVYNSEPWDGRVAEIGGSRAAMYSLLHRMGEIMASRHCAKLTFELPPDHAFVSCCAGLGCKLTTAYPHAEGGMARIIDQSHLLRELTPLLAERLERSSSQWRGTLAFKTQLGTDDLSLGSDEPRLVELSQETLTQLVLGYRAVDELAAADELTCDGAVLPLLATIFPQGFPYMWHPDRF